MQCPRTTSSCCASVPSAATSPEPHWTTSHFALVLVSKISPKHGADPIPSPPSPNLHLAPQHIHIPHPLLPQGLLAPPCPELPLPRLVPALLQHPAVERRRLGFTSLNHHQDGLCCRGDTCTVAATMMGWCKTHSWSDSHNGSETPWTPSPARGDKPPQGLLPFTHDAVRDRWEKQSSPGIRENPAPFWRQQENTFPPGQELIFLWSILAIQPPVLECCPPEPH